MVEEYFEQLQLRLPRKNFKIIYNLKCDLKYAKRNKYIKIVEYKNKLRKEIEINRRYIESKLDDEDEDEKIEDINIIKLFIEQQLILYNKWKEEINNLLSKSNEIEELIKLIKKNINKEYYIEIPIENIIFEFTFNSENFINIFLINKYYELDYLMDWSTLGTIIEQPKYKKIQIFPKIINDHNIYIKI